MVDFSNSLVFFNPRFPGIFSKPSLNLIDNLGHMGFRYFSFKFLMDAIITLALDHIPYMCFIKYHKIHRVTRLNFLRRT